MENKPAVFFDRDGVLNEDIGYLYRKEDFSWIQGAVETIRACNEKGYYVFVVTNQSGIARGFYTEEDVQNLHRWMNVELKKQNAYIDDFFYCPHYEQGKVSFYAQPCQCRKPKPGLIEAACQKYRIDRQYSFMIGDKESDLECAANANIRGIQFLGGDLSKIVMPLIQKTL